MENTEQIVVEVPSPIHASDGGIFISSMFTAIIITAVVSFIFGFWVSRRMANDMIQNITRNLGNTRF